MAKVINVPKTLDKTIIRSANHGIKRIKSGCVVFFRTNKAGKINIYSPKEASYDWSSFMLLYV